MFGQSRQQHVYRRPKRVSQADPHPRSETQNAHAAPPDKWLYPLVLTVVVAKEFVCFKRTSLYLQIPDSVLQL